jgi:hypothetical protein
MIRCKPSFFKKEKNPKTKKKNFKNKKIKIWRNGVEFECLISINVCVIHPEGGYFASCVLVYDVVRFVLRAFSGFLTGFCLFTLQLIHFGKILGLERLKMRCCVSEYPDKHD